MPTASRICGGGGAVAPAGGALTPRGRAEAGRLDLCVKRSAFSRRKSGASQTIVEIEDLRIFCSYTPADSNARNAKRPSSTEGDTFCHLAAKLAAGCFDVRVAEIAARSRCSPRVANARHVAMYLAHVVCGLSLASVGSGFKRDRSTVSYACRRVEDSRDDPAVDSMLAGLECSARIVLELESEKIAS